MKEKPSSFLPSSSERKKIRYKVIIDDQEFQTSAFNEEGAISNAAYRYAEDNDEEVRLVMWKIQNDQLDFEVEEIMKETSYSENPKFMQPYVLKPTVIPPDMCLVVDTREQHSPLFIAKPPKGLMVMRDTLKDGDYGIKGMPLFAIEKKYQGDLFTYCSTEREKTLEKMKRFRAMVDAGGWVGLLITERESDIFKHQTWTRIHPESVRGALVSFAIRYHVTIYFASSKERAERFILDHACKYYNVMKEV